MNSAPQEHDFRFPEGFLWGAATSSHQVEGGNRWNDWWAYEQAGRMPFVSGQACGHFETFDQDFELARSLGHNAHRLSIEWSRFEPEEGRLLSSAADHYYEVLGALRQRGIEPLVTLHHFTNPAWFLERGGWTRGDAPRRFARFVRFAAEALGDQVSHWVTINEPTVYARHAYLLAQWPPLAHNAWRKAARCLKHMARAHVLAYRILKERNPEVPVGFAHSAAHVLPCDGKRFADRMATALRDRYLNHWFLQRIGAPAHLDYLGLNYYNRTIVRSQGFGAGALLGRACRLPHHERGPTSQTGWEMYAPGLEAVLQRFSSLGLPLLVTENGIATEDEALRTRFLREHVAALARSLQSGVDVRGYLYWSLMDNFEWALGPVPRYGLAAVDARTLERHPRPCAWELERIARTGRLGAASSPYQS